MKVSDGYTSLVYFQYDAQFRKCALPTRLPVPVPVVQTDTRDLDGRTVKMTLQRRNRISLSVLR